MPDEVSPSLNGLFYAGTGPHFLLIYFLQGFYKGGKFVFSFKVSPNYPHDPPKVKCKTMVFHPNIDLEGNVCLNILREDWKPVLTINSIVYGLQYLFLVIMLSNSLSQDLPCILIVLLIKSSLVSSNRNPIPRIHSIKKLLKSYKQIVVYLNRVLKRRWPVA